MSNPASINDFKARLAGGGVRPTLFKVQMLFPQAAVESVSELAELGVYLIKATSLPPSRVGVISVPFRGRVLKVSGDRKFDDWKCQVINDRDFKIRRGFEKWSEIISNHAHIAGESEYSGYFSRAIISQLDRNNDVTRVYEIDGLWPTDVEEIPLSFGEFDTIEDFSVNFAVQYWNANQGADPAYSGIGFTTNTRTISS